jgi:hypothetical protein
VRGLITCRALTELKGAEVGQTYSTHAISVKYLQNIVFNFDERDIIIIIIITGYLGVYIV